MIIRTKTPYSGKGKIWMRFIIGEREFEKFFKVTFQGLQGGEFSYEADDDFPKEMVRLIFGYGAMMEKSEL